MLKILGLALNRNIVVYIDNNASLFIISTMKVSLKSVELAICAKVMMALDLTFPELKWFYRRVESKSNRWADALSRQKFICTNITERCILESLLIGMVMSDRLPNCASYILKEYMGFGQDQIPNMKETELE